VHGRFLYFNFFNFSWKLYIFVCMLWAYEIRISTKTVNLRRLEFKKSLLLLKIEPGVPTSGRVHSGRPPGGIAVGGQRPTSNSERRRQFEDVSLSGL